MIRPIQYLRGIAALTVVWFHALILTDGNMAILGAPQFSNAGVDLFFVISGFIMLITTWNRDITAGEFFQLRVVRVVPLYWAVTLLMFIGALVRSKSQFTGIDLVKSLLFIPYDSAPILVLGWTLNFEMFFYALFATSLLLPSRFRYPALIVCLLTLVAMGFAHWDTTIMQAYTNPALLEFLAGSIIAYLWIHKRLEVGIFPSVGMIAIGGALLFAGDLFTGPRLIGASLILVGSLNASIQAIKNGLLQSLGDASYSIYLSHHFTLAALLIVWVRLHLDVTLASVTAFMTLALASSTIAGWLCYRWVEKPMTSRLHSLVKRRKAFRDSMIATPARSLV